MKKLLFYMILLFSCNLIAQENDDLLEMAMANFKPKNTNRWWLKTMNGYMDNTHEVRMVLATDNENFKGAYEVLSSKERFYLEGNHDGEQIVLVETDSLERITGYIKGDMNDDRFYCTWSDPKNLIRLPLFLYHNSPSDNLCGNNGWAKYWRPEDKLDTLIGVTIIKNEDKLKAILRYPVNHIVLDLESQNDGATKLANLPSSILDTMNINIDIDKFTIKFFQGNKQVSKKFVEKKSLVYNCNTFLDFDEKLSFNFPMTSDKKFNKYVKDSFVEKYMTTSMHNRTPQSDHSIYDRHIRQESGIFKVEIFNDTLISGVFTFQSSTSNAVYEYPLNYLFKKKKPFDFKQPFLKDFDFKKEINKLINEEKNKLDKNSETYEYFKNIDYDIIFFSTNGFKCKSKFSTIFGEDFVIVPYSKLYPYCKKRKLLN